MSPDHNSLNHPIRVYMDALASHLGRLEKADADEVIREIDSHIHDVLDQAKARGEPIDVAELLAGFGPPATLAAQYIAHIQTGTPPPAGFRVIQRVKQSVTRGLYYSMAVFGFSIALAFLMLALAKLFDPAAVGVWSAAEGNSATISWAGSPYPVSEELLGWSLVPIALLAGVWCAELTRRVLRILKRHLI